MTGAILAGGRSERMGFNKAFIKVGSETIMERTVKVFKETFDDFFIVANDILAYEDLSVTVMSDIIKGAGSLGGIYTALFHSPSDYIFIAACDMPSLNKDAITAITSQKGDYDIVVPEVRGRLHPMHAMYSRGCLETIEGMIREGDLRISGLLKKARTRRMGEEEFKSIPIVSSVENINTREDLQRITGQNPA